MVRRQDGLTVTDLHLSNYTLIFFLISKGHLNPTQHGFRGVFLHVSLVECQTQHDLWK